MREKGEREGGKERESEREREKGKEPPQNIESGMKSPCHKVKAYSLLFLLPFSSFCK
jgi:hypothetical protein